MWHYTSSLWRNTSVVWNKKVFLQIMLIAIAAAFIFIGVHRGEAKMVFDKAVRICLECIGIG